MCVPVIMYVDDILGLRYKLVAFKKMCIKSNILG